jgi:hypothetical protein
MCCVLGRTFTFLISSFTWSSGQVGMYLFAPCHLVVGLLGVAIQRLHIDLGKRVVPTPLYRRLVSIKCLARSSNELSLI